MHALRTPFRLVPNRAMAVVLILALPHSAGAVQDPFAGIHALKDDQLEQLRGGFENNQGLQFSFAIERAVVINGDLVTSTRLVLNDLMPLLSGGVPTAEITNSVRSIVQNGLGNTISPAPTGQPAATAAAAPAAPAPGAAQASVSAPSSAAVAPAASIPATASASASSIASVSSLPPTLTTPAPAAIAAGQSPSSSPGVSTSAASSQAQAPSVSTSAAPSQVQAPGVSTSAAPSQALAPSVPSSAAPSQALAPSDTASLFIQRNAGGQTIVIPNASAIVTAVQNSVNNQIIQTRTTIDAMLNSLSALRANMLANSIRQQSLDSVRRQ